MTDIRNQYHNELNLSYLKNKLGQINLEGEGIISIVRLSYPNIDLNDSNQNGLELFVKSILYFIILLFYNYFQFTMIKTRFLTLGMKHYPWLM